MSFGQRLEENYRQIQDSVGQLDQKIETSSINLGKQNITYSRCPISGFWITVTKFTITLDCYVVLYKSFRLYKRSRLVLSVRTVWKVDAVPMFEYQTSSDFRHSLHSACTYCQKKIEEIYSQCQKRQATLEIHINCTCFSIVLVSNVTMNNHHINIH